MLSRQIVIAEFSLLYIHQDSKVHFCGIKNIYRVWLNFLSKIALKLMQ